MSPSRTKNKTCQGQTSSLRANGQYVALGSCGDTPIVLLSYRKDDSDNRILQRSLGRGRRIMMLMMMMMIDYYNDDDDDDRLL